MTMTFPDENRHTCPKCGAVVYVADGARKYTCQDCKSYVVILPPLTSAWKVASKVVSIVLVLAGWTFAACDAHASDCQHSPAVAHAEATLLEAQARWAEATLDPPSQARQRATLEALVASALEARRAAIAACTPSQPPAYASPFEDDPWEPIDQGVPQVDRTVDRMVDSYESDPAWCAVMGCETSANSVVLP